MSKKHAYKCECFSCKKHFHITSRQESEEEGTEKMMLSCPFCERELMVELPRGAVPFVDLLRTIPASEAS